MSVIYGVNKNLTKRIDALEKRIDELERHVSQLENRPVFEPLPFRVNPQPFFPDLGPTICGAPPQPRAFS
jgi:hypothetical protein